jgi:pullulanase
MGATIDGRHQANQKFIGEITPTGDAIGAVAVFNDVIRDGLKGSVFEEETPGYVNGGADEESWANVLFGINGGQENHRASWSVPDSMVINYMSAHDNNTLWDKLLLSNPNNSDNERNRMNKLGAAIIMISKGTPFWQAGEEMLRTKDGDENSYKSSDEINNIRWDVLKEGSKEYETMLYYKGLIEMRKSLGIFASSTSTVTCTEQGSGILEVLFEDVNGEKALVVINPNKTALPYVLDGEWNLVADGETAGSDVLAKESGNINVPSISVRVYANDALVK